MFCIDDARYSSHFVLNETNNQYFLPEPPFPTVPNTFSTKLEAIIADRNMTVSGEEYFDYNNNRAALFMLNGDQISKLIFDYSTEELFYVYRKYIANGGRYFHDAKL